MWTRTLLATSVATALVFGASVNAATNKDDDNDSVRSWGPWNGVQTAAGPSAGSAPLLIQFANSNNVIKRDDFQSPVVDNAGYREYGVWRTRGNKLGENAVARADHEVTRLILKRNRADKLDFVVTNDLNENTYSPRLLSGYYDDKTGSGYFSNTKRVNNKNGSYRYNHQYYNVSGVVTVDGGEGAGPGYPPFIPFFILPPQQQELSQEDIAFLQGYWSGSDSMFNSKGQYKGHRVNNRGVFIAGQTSTIDSVSNLLAGNVVASYSGRFMSGGAVNLTLNLGANPSWSGTFNGNFEQNLNHLGPRMGSKGSMVEFSVNNGTFNGVDLNGSVNSNGVTGVVEASFFGKGAEHINGITDVNHVERGAMIDVFSTTIEGKVAVPVGGGA